MTTDKEIEYREQAMLAWEEVLQPSLDIANSAISLTTARCVDMDMPSVVALLLLAELAKRNARFAVEARQRTVEKAVADHFPEFQGRLFTDADDSYKIVSEMVAACMDRLSTTEVKVK